MRRYAEGSECKASTQEGRSFDLGNGVRPDIGTLKYTGARLQEPLRGNCGDEFHSTLKKTAMEPHREAAHKRLVLRFKC